MSACLCLSVFSVRLFICLFSSLSMSFREMRRKTNMLTNASQHDEQCCVCVVISVLNPLVSRSSGVCLSDGHAVIDKFRRDVNYTASVDNCDSSLSEGWYRFLLNGTNAIIPTSCVGGTSALCVTDNADIWTTKTDPSTLGQLIS